MDKRAAIPVSVCLEGIPGILDYSLFWLEWCDGAFARNSALHAAPLSDQELELCGAESGDGNMQK